MGLLGVGLIGVYVICGRCRGSSSYDVVCVSPVEDAVAAEAADVVAAVLSGSWTPAVAGGGKIGD